jgi:hypothetical protein
LFSAHRDRINPWFQRIRWPGAAAALSPADCESAQRHAGRLNAPRRVVPASTTDLPRRCTADDSSTAGAASGKQVIPLFAFSPEVRKIIYATNAIESLRNQVRKTIRNKGYFPSDDAAIKLIYLSLRQIEATWKPLPKE